MKLYEIKDYINPESTVPQILREKSLTDQKNYVVYKSLALATNNPYQRITFSS